ncbi:MAG: hypothetical protein RLY70_3852, partial [Planctomycetota bacterium]
ADNAEAMVFFEQKIRPVLVDQCYSCHSAEAQSNKKLQGQLLLDSAEGLLAGGETGPAIVKGKSAESLLMKALRHDGLEMPPSGKLSAEVIADFARWIDSGAFDPRVGGAVAKPKRTIDLEEGRRFWSFRPLGEVSLPTPKSADWAVLPIDRFVAAKHEELGLRASPMASKETMLRRVYFDLIGLPPSSEQLDAFLADASPQAWEKVVDELLASPHYGERWGRHWLDAARFAESGGYEFDGFRPGAYHYRDWVIRALNADMPYDQFLRMQLAGDKLAPGYEGASATGFLVAGPYPGQITAKTVERIRYDQLDDMMMTIGGSMLGLTLGCVRCHEHKYDPLPHQDYYALAANLAKTSHGNVSLDPDPPASERKRAEHAAELAKRQTAIDEFAQRELSARVEKWRQAELPKLTREPRWQTLDIAQVTTGDTGLVALDDGIVAVDGPRRKDSDTYKLVAHTFQRAITGVRLDAFTDKALPRKGPGLGGDGSFALGDLKISAKPLDPNNKQPAVVLKLKAVQAAFEEPKQQLALAVDDNPGTAWRANTDTGKDNAALLSIEGGFAGFPGGAEWTIELKFAGPGLGRFRLSLTTEPGSVTWAGESTSQHLAEMKQLLADHKNAIPESARPYAFRWFAPFDAEAGRLRSAYNEWARAVPRPALTDVYSTVAGGQDVFFLRRGEVDNKNGKAEPGHLQVLTRVTTAAAANAATNIATNATTNAATNAATTAATTAPAATKAPAASVDPRVTMGQWMTDVEQGAGPLAARVIANRLWHHHFGRGLVRTTNDFGAQGERPTHPELLEWLAAELVRGGWKLKPLHKQMVMSMTYRQGSSPSADNQRLDPENRYLWQARVRRLEAESIRDSLLAVGGTMDKSMYGPSVLDNTPRRSVYLRVKRSELIPFMTMFDAPEPTQSIGERISTTVPTQALAMLNSPFVRGQAEKLAARIKAAGANASLTNAVDQAYRLAFARRPSDVEREQALAFLASQIVPASPASGAAPASPPPLPTLDKLPDLALVELCHSLLCLNEFVYVD